MQSQIGLSRKPWFIVANTTFWTIATAVAYRYLTVN
jgi:hypothetical protein